MALLTLKFRKWPVEGNRQCAGLMKQWKEFSVSLRWNLQPSLAVVKLWIVHRSTKEVSVPEITSFDLKHVFLLAKLVTTWAEWASEVIHCKVHKQTKLEVHRKKLFRSIFARSNSKHDTDRSNFPFEAAFGAFEFIMMATIQNMEGLIENLQWLTIQRLHEVILLKRNRKKHKSDYEKVCEASSSSFH